jgi:hypothetical protein
MKLITEFENAPIQNVKTFNKIFQSTPITDVDESLEVQIGEPSAGDERIVRVGEIEIRLCLLQRKYPRKVIPRTYKVVAFDTKQCTRCKIVKPFTEFNPHKTSKGGIRSRCKTCCVRDVMDWKRRNKERVNEDQNKRNAEKKLTQSKKQVKIK